MVDDSTKEVIIDSESRQNIKLEKAKRLEECKKPSVYNGAQIINKFGNSELAQATLELQSQFDNMLNNFLT